MILFGRLITNAGDGFYSIAMLWLVHTVTGSTIDTGLAGFLVTIPDSAKFLFGPLVDRWSIKWLLISSQVVQGIFVCIMALIAMHPSKSIIVISLLIIFIVPLTNQVSYPAEVVALTHFVPPRELTQANTWLSIIYRGSSSLFYAIAGWLIIALGLPGLLFVDVATFLITGSSYLFLPSIPQEDASASEPSYWYSLREGLRYVQGTLLKWVLFGAVLGNLAIGAGLAVLPFYAGQLGGVVVYGWMMGGMAIGGLLGALLSMRVKNLPIGYLTIGLFLGGSILWLGSALTHNAIWATILFALAWLPMGTTNVLLLTALQKLVPRHLVGRVISLTISVSSVAMPLGYLVGGLSGHWVGVRETFLFSGAGILAIGGYWLAHRTLRRLPTLDKLQQLVSS